MKKTVFLLISVLILVMTFSLFVSAERYVTVVLDTEVLEFDVQPQIINGRTMVPLRKIFESMGATVDWDDESRTAFAQKNTRFVEAQIDNFEMRINGTPKTLDTAPMLLGGRTIPPVRFVAEAFGVLVGWDDATSTVTLTSPENVPLNSMVNMAYQYDLTPYISIDREDYIGVEYPTLSSEITTDDITEAVTSLMAEHVEYVEVERASSVGDAINIDYKGYVNGRELENGAEESCEFILGSSSFIPGFEEGIIGHRAGESFDVEVTFPEDYGVEELNGVKAVFKMKLNSVKEVIYPQLDDNFIASVTDSSTLVEYIEVLTHELRAAKIKSNTVQQKNEAFANISKNIVIHECPKAEYDGYYNQYYAQYESLAAQYGVSFEVLITAYAQSTLAEFEEYAKDYAQSSVEMELVFFAIANRENLLGELTKADYIAYLDELAVEYETNAENFETTYGIDSVAKSLVYDIALDFILENGKAV